MIGGWNWACWFKVFSVGAMEGNCLLMYLSLLGISGKFLSQIDWRILSMLGPHLLQGSSSGWELADVGNVILLGLSDSALDMGASATPLQFMAL